MKAFLLFYAIACVLGVSMIWLVGYPGDGAKGVNTAFGQAERARAYQVARGWR